MRNYILLLLLSVSLSVSAQINRASFWGHWLKKSYLDNVLTKRSVYHAQKFTGEVTEIIFAKALGDTVWICYDNVEGVKYPYKFVSETAVVVKLDNGSSVRLSLGRTDNNQIELTYMDEGNNVLEGFVYHENPDLEFNSLHKWVNHKLLAGAYALSIEDGQRLRGPQEVSVRFLEDGTLMGVPGYNRYEIMTYFDNFANFDVVRFYNTQSGESVWRGWEVKNNRLLLYSLKRDDEFKHKRDFIIKQLERDNDASDNERGLGARRQ